MLTVARLPCTRQVSGDPGVATVREREVPLCAALKAGAIYLPALAVFVTC